MFLNAYVTGFPIDLNSAFQYVQGDLAKSFYQNVSAKEVSTWDDQESFYYRPAALLNILDSIATRDIVLKTHNANVEVDGIPLIPPKLTKGSVYLIRDPRDVSISFAKHLNVSIDEAITLMQTEIQTLGEDLYHILLSWSSHVRSWKTKVFQYEDLFEEKTFKELLKAFGLTYEEHKFTFAMQEVSFENLKNKEEDTGFREAKNNKFFNIGTPGSWREYLSIDQRDKIESYHKEVMQTYGYL